MEPAWLAAVESTAIRAGGAGGMAPMATAGPTGLSPAQIRRAYGVEGLSFDGRPADGSGTTIAIVTAYDSPNVAADLATFDATFGLPAPPSFRKVNQNGGTTLPGPNASWSSETCLDVQWAHAIAPGASILVVEASSNSNVDLMAAVRTARAAPGVVAVSMSWGQREFPGETSLDATFTTPAGHGGVTFFAASGDSGAPGIYPAMSPNVVAVGGTSLTISATGTVTESAWRGSGGGTSMYEARPAFQSATVAAGVAKRSTPDVALVADPATGLAVCDSRAHGRGTPWTVYGGTSIAAPQWAGIAAIVAQGRALRGLPSLDGATQFLPALYSMPATNFSDVVTGASLGTPRQPATVGYDLATGRGTPRVAALVRDLVAFGSREGIAPGAPTGFTAKASGATTVKLVWGAAVGASGYSLHEITGGGRTLLANYGPEATSATLTGLAPGSTHSYRLEAWNGAGTVEVGADVTLPAGLVAPSALTANAVSRTTVELSWTASPGARTQSIFVWSGLSPRRGASLRAGVTTVRVGGLTPGSTVRLAVRAEDGTTTALSEWLSVTLPA